MKYQRLSIAELELLTKEFVQFLALNGIAAEDWEQIKVSNRAKMDSLLDQFSDLVWDTTIQESAYFLLLQNQEIIAFYCSIEEMKMLNLRLENAEGFSFFNYENLNVALSCIPDSAVRHHSSHTRLLKNVEERSIQVYSLLKGAYKIIQKEQWDFLFEQIK